MNEKTSALYSEYIIDGLRQELTPARMLDSCLASAPVCTESSAGYEPVVDETIDPALKPCVTDPSKVEEYWRAIKAQDVKVFPTAFPETYAKTHIAFSLIDAIWRDGHFRLDDLALGLGWKWNQKEIGSMTAFYASVAAAVDYIDLLGLRIADYSFERTEGESCIGVSAVLAPQKGGDGEDDFFGELPFRTEHPKMGGGACKPAVLQKDEQSWLIYIPFENSVYRLGASRLAQVLGVQGAVAPQILDPDYFIDCYEVVRELVEDGIVLAGATVGEGGLYTALKGMAADGCGICAELADLARATGEGDIVRLLFSEVPGVLVQIADSDYDYVDAELLLQDVAFYPLGHPREGGVEAVISENSGVRRILESLISSRSSEGED